MGGMLDDGPLGDGQRPGDGGVAAAVVMCADLAPWADLRAGEQLDLFNGLRVEAFDLVVEVITVALRCSLAFQGRHFCPCACRHLLLTWWRDSPIPTSQPPQPPPSLP